MDRCSLSSAPASPLLQSSPPSPPPSPPHLPHNPRCHRFRLCSFTTLLVVSVLALFALFLGLSPAHSPPKFQPPLVSHEDDDIDTSPPTSPSPPSPNHDFAAQPRLRNASEYMLDLSWPAAAGPTTREYHWTIVDALLNPDGVFRPMTLINNQFPGPLVQCNQGDTIVLHVQNRAANATAIHFHGLFQNGSNFMDGAVGITQCPIAPNSSFTYRFTVAAQSGTYWYHAHHSAQASDGLLGPVVVHAPREPKPDYASDRIVMVQDHYHNTTAQLLMDYLQPDRENDEPVPDSALINGRGLRNCSEFPGWPCDDSSLSRPTLNLAAGQRHRLRFINTGAFAQFQIQVDEHSFYITEVDGVDVYPEPFHRLNILPAQRYSIVVETNMTARRDFWLRARMVTNCFTRENDHLDPEIRAALRYRASSDSDSNSDSDSDVSPAWEAQSNDWKDTAQVVCRDLNTTLLHPVEHMTVPPADHFVSLDANFMIGAWRLSRGFFNDSTWHPNVTRPSLHRFLDATPANQLIINHTMANHTMPPPLTPPTLTVNDAVFSRDNDFVLQTSGIRTIDIAINNFDDGAHSFHLHGHRFFVLAQASDGYPPPADQWTRHATFDNPLRRDTLTVESYAWAIIRVVLDNPGMWALHCHNAWHAEAGMLMQLLVRADVVRHWSVDAAHRQLCTRPGVTSGVRPDDSIWFGSF